MVANRRLVVHVPSQPPVSDDRPDNRPFGFGPTPALQRRHERGPALPDISRAAPHHQRPEAEHTEPDEHHEANQQPDDEHPPIIARPRRVWSVWCTPPEILLSDMSFHALATVLRSFVPERAVYNDILAVAGDRASVEPGVLQRVEAHLNQHGLEEWLAEE